MGENAFDMIPGLVPAGGGSTAGVTGGRAGSGGSGGSTFGDFLSSLNPLQNLPVVGTIYRAITGESVLPGLRVVGSLVFGIVTGGPIGVLGSLGGLLLDDLLGSGSKTASGAGPAASASQAAQAPQPSAAAPTQGTSEIMPLGFALRPSAGQTVTLAAPTETTPAAAVAAYRNVSAYALG